MKNIILTAVSVILVIVTIVANILLTVGAFTSAGKNFWDMITTNQTGAFFIVWGQNPLGAAGVLALSIITIITLAIARENTKN